MTKQLIYLFIISLFSISLFSQESNHYESLFNVGNEAYSDGKYREAEQYFLEILEADYESAKVYFNLANTYYKLDEIPAAILYYEKAKKLAPQDPDIQFNLEIANQRVTDKIDVVPEFITSKIWKGLFSLFTVDTWGYFSIAFLFFSVLFFLLYLTLNNIAFRKTSFTLSIIGFVITVICYTGAYQQKNHLTNQSSPDTNGEKLFVLHEGTKVKVLESNNDWLRIAIASGNIGWLKKSDLRLI